MVGHCCSILHQLYQACDLHRVSALHATILIKSGGRRTTKLEYFAVSPHGFSLKISRSQLTRVSEPMPHCSCMKATHWLSSCCSATGVVAGDARAAAALCSACCPCAVGPAGAVALGPLRFASPCPTPSVGKSCASKGGRLGALAGGSFGRRWAASTAIEVGAAYLGLLLSIWK